MISSKLAQSHDVLPYKNKISIKSLETMPSFISLNSAQFITAMHRRLMNWIVLYFVLRSVVLYCIVMYCIVSNNVVLYCAALHCIALLRIIFYGILLFRTVAHCVLLYRIILYRSALNHVVLHYNNQAEEAYRIKWHKFLQTHL